MRTFKNTLVAIIVMAVTMSLTSCGGGTPKGDDSDVKELAQSLCIKVLKDKNATMAYFGMPTTLGGSTISYDWLVEKAGKNSDDAKKAIANLDVVFNTKTTLLGNIRIIEVNDDIKKSVNQGTLTVTTSKGSETYEVVFSAQRNADGDVYVEVQFK